MDDDLNTSKALAVLFDLANKANKDVDYAYTLLYKLATTLAKCRHIEKPTLEDIFATDAEAKRVAGEIKDKFRW